MASEEGSGSEMWPVVCFHGYSSTLGELWYTFDYEKLSLVGQLQSESSGGWAIVGDDIYWAGGETKIGRNRVQSRVSKNLLKHNITIPRSSAWETIFDERKLVRKSPFVVPVDRKLYVLGGDKLGNHEDSDSGRQYWGELYDLDSEKWEKVLELDDSGREYWDRCFSPDQATVMRENGGVPTTVIFYSVGRMLFYNLNEGTLRYEYHPSLDVYSHNSRDSKGLEAIYDREESRILGDVFWNSRPVVRDSTLYWFTYDLYLYGYDFIRERWLRSPYLKSEISIMSPNCSNRSYPSPVLVDLCNGKFLVIHDNCGGLAIASLMVVKGKDSLTVSVETRHILTDLPNDFRLQDGMAMTYCKVVIRTKNSYTNGIHPIFKIVSDIVHLQLNHDMASYLGQVETLKDQFNSLMPFTNNLNDQERQLIDIFFVGLALNGLRHDQIPVRHQILSSLSTPTLEEVSARLLCISSATEVTSHETSEKHCTHCDRMGHTRDSCDCSSSQIPETEWPFDKQCTCDGMVYARDSCNWSSSQIPEA